jgi:hypothetical protein
MPPKKTQKAPRVRNGVRAGAPAPAAPLDAVFDGTCVIEIFDVPSAPPVERYPLCCDVRIDAGRGTVTLLGFEPIATDEYPARLGPLEVTNSTMVHLRSAETGRLTRDGHFAMPVVLYFDHAFDAPFYEEDSDLALTLSTKAAGGVPLDERGHATLVGSGRFTGGALDGKRCTLTYEGWLKPMPW